MYSASHSGYKENYYSDDYKNIHCYYNGYDNDHCNNCCNIYSSEYHIHDHNACTHSRIVIVVLKYRP